MESILEAKQKEVNDAEYKLMESKLERDLLIDKIETCEADIDRTNGEIKEISLELVQLNSDANKYKKEIENTSELISKQSLKKQKIEISIQEKEVEIKVKLNQSFIEYQISKIFTFFRMKRMN